jgi:beta-xylosidase
MVNAFARSRIGFKSFLYMSPIEPDCSGVLEDGQFIYDGHATQPTIEGPKLYKRNGYYYIFAPAGGVQTGWQTVLRSRNIYGPYEEKIVLHQGSSPVNGPHQGAWVDTPEGQDWFLHFQDVGNAGRILHLQPMHWEEDWPVIGVHEVDGCGEPVLRYQKPDVGRTYPIEAPEDSDFFEGDKLGLQWQWNANYSESWYELKGGRLKLNARKTEAETQLCDVPNLLLQKWPAPEFQITACLELENMADGDAAGMVSQCGHYTGLAVVRRGENYYLQQRTGNWAYDDESRTDLRELSGLNAQGQTPHRLYLRMYVRKETYVSFAISLDEEHFEMAGETVEAAPGRWVGVKTGLFAIHEGNGEGGSVKADYFVYEPLEKVNL